jgi:hypothetical protein
MMRVMGGGGGGGVRVRIKKRGFLRAGKRTCVRPGLVPGGHALGPGAKFMSKNDTWLVKLAGYTVVITFAAGATEPNSVSAVALPPKGPG